MLVEYGSFLLSASLVAIAFRSLEASGDAPPLQLNTTGVNVPFSDGCLKQQEIYKKIC